MAFNPIESVAGSLGQVASGTSALELGGGGVASEARVQREMREQGMAVPSGGAPGAAHENGGFSAIFGKALGESIDQVNLHQVQADAAIKELVAGRSKNIHETLLTVERADTSLKLMMQVRNKVLDAYREIMKMQV